MSLVLSMILSLVSLNTLHAEVNPVNFPSNGIKSISVSVPKGKIVLTSSKSQKEISVNIVEVKKDTKDNKCIKSTGLENAQLVVKVSSENILFEKAECVYDITVTVPATQSFDMDLSSGTAAISVTNVTGTLNVKTGTGTVMVNGDLLKNISAKSGTGAMTFVYKTCSGRADLDLLSGTGNMAVKLPASCKIRVDYKSATGKLFNELGETQDYQVMINAKSGSGDFSINKI